MTDDEMDMIAAVAGGFARRFGGDAKEYLAIAAQQVSSAIQNEALSEVVTYVEGINDSLRTLANIMESTQ